MSDAWSAPTSGAAPPPPSEEGAFPYDASADFSTLFDYALARWKEHIVNLSAASLIFFVAIGAASFASSFVSQIVGVAIGTSGLDSQAAILAGGVVGQLISTAANTLATTVFIGGLYRMVLDALTGRPVSIGALVLPGGTLLRVFAAQIALSMISLTVMAIIALPAAGAMLARGISLDEAGLVQAASDPITLGAVLFGSLASLVAGLLLLPISMFTIPEIVVSEAGAFEAMARAWEIGSGQRFRMIGYALVAGLISAGGVLLCCVGAIPATPLGYAVTLALFLALRAGTTARSTG
jgi:hypothetical protein